MSEPTVDQMKAELLAFGWVQHRGHATIWKSPEGTFYRGPYAAWKVATDNGKKSKSLSVSDVAIRFAEDGESFSIFIMKEKRVKTFVRRFKADQLYSYISDWQDWPTMTDTEMTTVKNAFAKSKPL